MGAHGIPESTLGWGEVQFLAKGVTIWETRTKPSAQRKPVLPSKVSYGSPGFRVPLNFSPFFCL